MATLETYKELEVLDSATGAGGAAISDNFRKLADRFAYLSTSDPTATDDDTEGFALGSRWFNTVSQVEFICTDPTEDAAVWVAVYRSGSQSLAYASTVTPILANGAVVNVGTLTGNVTIAAPTGAATDGQILRFRFAQDGTGGRSITWNAAFAFGTDVTTGLIPVAAGAKFELVFSYHSGDSKWRATGIVRGF